MSTKNELFESPFYEKLDEKKVRCTLCNHRCLIVENKKGICNVRKNVGGKLYSLNKNLFIALNIDPIEKKPLFHFMPGSFSFSIATVGCNFRCLFCQNYEISQIEEREVVGSFFESKEIVEKAVEEGCRSISYTYTEPTIFFETAYEVGVLARDKGLKNIFVTNGYISKEATLKAKDFLDAANVDLKSFKKETYTHYCGATLQGVLEGIDNLLEAGCFIEITTLLVPGVNDGEDELRAIAKFIASRSKEIPWHISRFFPNYKMENCHPTPLPNIEKAFKIGKEEGLEYVYKGNVWGEGENTYCPKCNALLIERRGFEVLRNLVDNGICVSCGRKINGFF